MWRNLDFTGHQIILLLAYAFQWHDSYQTTSPNLNGGPKMPSDHGDFLVELQALCQAIAQGQYDGLDSLFALTGSDEVPEDIRDLAEAFGSMVVQIEAREFRLELWIIVLLVAEVVIMSVELWLTTRAH